MIFSRPMLMSSQSTILERFKPRTSRRAQLLLAAIMWSAVGVGLSTAGVVWLVRSESDWMAPLMTLAVALGLVKGLLVLRRAANRITTRILERGDGRCAGGFLSWKTWLFVIGMMAIGQILRRSGLPLPWLGTIYLAVGVALGGSSLFFWRTVRQAAGHA